MSDDEARLVEIAAFLRNLPNPDIDPRFAARLEARLLAVVPDPEPVAEPERDRAPGVVIVFPRRRFVVRKAIIGMVAAASLTAVPILAARTALPTSPLYGLKLRIERVQIAMTRGTVARGFREIEFAQARLEEAEQLTHIGLDVAVPRTLRLMQAHLSAGTNLILAGSPGERTLTRLAIKLRQTSGGLDGLLGLVPVEIRPAILEAIESGRALAHQVALALVAMDPAVPVAATAAQPARVRREALDPAPLDSRRMFRDPNAYASGYAPATGAPGETDPNESTDNDAEQAPCLATVYQGPSAGTIHGACLVASNQQGATNIGLPVLPGGGSPGAVQPPQDGSSSSGPQQPAPEQKKKSKVAGAGAGKAKPKGKK